MKNKSYRELIIYTTFGYKDHLKPLSNSLFFESAYAMLSVQYIWKKMRKCAHDEVSKQL